MIRLLETQDLDVFKRLRLEALSSTPEAYAASLEDWQALPEMEWLRRITETLVFVAFRRREPMGMMGLIPKKPSKMAHRAKIVMVYVREEERGTGVACDLLDCLTRHARSIGIRQLELGVNADNSRAIRFYEREGYSVIGRIPGGYLHEGRGIDEVLMVRQID